MAFESLADFTNRFYENEYKSLILNYPGITTKRILSELKTLSSLYSIQDIYSSIYFNIPGTVYSDFFENLKAGMPLEYISHRAYFYKSEFMVAPEVLIPRSETEILVESVVQLAKDMMKTLNGPLHFCDIGTGSGAIAISVLCELDFYTDCVATDISADALAVASRNYFLQQFKINQSSKIEFIETDKLLNIDKKFHIIVSNPPYIKKNKDFETVHEQVIKFEPHQALFLEDEIYETWFNDLFSQVEEALFSGGIFFMEGHEDHLEALSLILGKYNFTNIEIIKDYTQRNRFLKGIKKCKN